jgi:hypothetical protein
MKNKIVLSVFALLLLLGCGKEQLVPVPKDQKPKDLMAIPFSNSLETSPVVVLDHLLDNSGTGVNERESSNASVNAHFSPLAGFEVTLSGMQNNGGIHGNGQIKSEWVYFQFETACLNFAGNEVVYGAMITKVHFISEAWEAAFPGAIRVGRYLVLKMADYGEGQNAPPDQCSQYFWTSTMPFCNIFTPDHPVWLYPIPYGIGPMVDVIGQIQVK